MIAFLSRLFLLCVGHAFSDVAFQTEWMAVNKHRRRLPTVTEEKSTALWVFALTAHALVNAGVVIIITGSVPLGVLEFVAHWLIDFGKTEGWYNLITDQALHLTSKIVWCIL